MMTRYVIGQRTSNYRIILYFDFMNLFGTFMMDSCIYDELDVIMHVDDCALSWY